MSDLEVIRRAQSSARVYAHGERQRDPDMAAIDAYQADVLTGADGVNRRDLWNSQQELLYRLAYAMQLVALGL
jgi:hypothetical protein